MADDRTFHQETRSLPAFPTINAKQTSGADAAQTYTITPGADQRVCIYEIEAFTSAGTCTLTIESPSSTVVYSTPTGAINTTAWYKEPFIPMVYAKGVAVLIKLSTAGGGNTSTVNVRAGIL